MKKVTLIHHDEWDDLVRQTYGKPYWIQQQCGCMANGSLIDLSVPGEPGDYTKESIVEIVNGPEEGVSFKSWLAREPKEPLKDEKEGQKDGEFYLDIFWARNFYPDIQTVANDLYERGLLDAGDYIIRIEW